MRIILFFSCWLLSLSCKTTYDLVIENAKVFDTKRGVTLDNQTILINADTIADVVNTNKSLKGVKTIDAKSKLITPGIIDAHIHPTHFFGDYDAAPRYLADDSLAFLRKKFSDNYLPFGVTAVMIMGQPETWLKPILSWSINSSSDYTDIYTVGGALISKEDRKPYICHITVGSPLAAKQKVTDYYNMGIKNIKLYWRLRSPEFKAAVETAKSLGINVYAHIDNGIMDMDSTLTLGVKNYEHLFTILHSIPFAEEDGKKIDAWMQRFYSKDELDSMSFIDGDMNEARFTLDNKLADFDSLVDELAKHHATFSTTIHLFAEKFGLSYFSNPNNKPDSSWSLERTKRNADNFKAFMFLIKRVYDKGIRIRIGTDCPNGGKAALSEQLLLYEYGFSIPAILQISSINGATALGMDNKYGSIEKGKKADLIIYDNNPFDGYKNFLSSRTIIKDGKVFYPSNANK